MISNEDLLKEISLKALTQFSDLNGTGALNQAIIDDALADALALIKSFILIPANPTPLLKKIAVDLTIVELKRKNNYLQEDLKEVEDKAQALLLKMANKKIPTQVDQAHQKPLQRQRAFRHSHTREDWSL